MESHHVRPWWRKLRFLFKIFKNSENLWFFNIFRGFKKRPVTWNGLNTERFAFHLTRTLKTMPSFNGNLITSKAGQIRQCWHWYSELKKRISKNNILSLLAGRCISCQFLIKKSLIENFIFCAVSLTSSVIKHYSYQQCLF